jgi:hypothetical protein
MAKLTRQLHERIRGDNTENRDWWRLAFDTEAKRFYVEHEWSHTDAWRAARSNNGTVEFDINGFLGEDEAPAQAELLRIIESVFEEGGGENECLEAPKANGSASQPEPLSIKRKAKMSWQFTVGLRVKGKADRMVVDAEDALIAALKAKADQPGATIMYVRRSNRRGDTRHPPRPHTGGH